ncbi:DUF2768 family protein [Cohnella sp. REN36]|uniref:DUF2768 family protein n=1 Tax=Cohnella sp. REN36 TaxID=2887347 RepID=UPI001D152FF3|nr:DUF2768 family protein [Cohnella sp. REN36]MCC3373500.1 DUF2768 domain-containing protein [Cohnella sp. REN36]
MDPMMKMWVSFVGIGLMVLSAVLIMVTRTKTKGWLRFVLSLVAFVMLLVGMVCGLISII